MGIFFMKVFACKFVLQKDRFRKYHLGNFIHGNNGIISALSPAIFGCFPAGAQELYRRPLPRRNFPQNDFREGISEMILFKKQPSDSWFSDPAVPTKNFREGFSEKKIM